MKRSITIALFLSIAAVTFLQLDSRADGGNPPGNGGISMLLYPVVRGDDGNQYLITPSGKHVTVPGLVIAPDATQVPVYRDSANHFWYTAMNGAQVAVTPQQLEAAQAQINAQSGGGGMSPQMVSQQNMPPAQSYYSSNPSYAGGYNGIPYGTPINIEGPGQYSYMGQGGNKQFITTTPQINNHLNQWQQQVPYGQQANMQGGQQMQGSTSQYGGLTRGQMRRERRADRLENRSQNQANEAASDQNYANEKMQSGQTLGTGFRSRKSAREQRRSNREERRADFLRGD